MFILQLIGDFFNTFSFLFHSLDDSIGCGSGGGYHSLVLVFNGSLRCFISGFIFFWHFLTYLKPSIC